MIDCEPSFRCEAIDDLIRKETKIMKTTIKRTYIAPAVMITLALMTGYGSGSLPVYGQPGENPDLAASKLRQSVKGKYAEVNGLKMYYEVHGSGQPLVLLHGAFGFVEGWATILPTLTKTHQVIALELQGHGHTNDLDRPITYEQHVEDTAALLKQLKIKDADFFGYSMGGVVALGVAIRYPELVRKLAVLGSGTGPLKDIFEPENYKQFQSLSTDFAPPVLKEPYDRMSPDPSRWPILVTKIKNMGNGFKGYSSAELKTIKAPTLIMQGDHDGTRPEHAVEVFRLIPNSQLAIFPGGDHFILFSGPDKILATLTPFLAASGQK
jgi:pimeloyl-ACP methyl ester carboxylesterase